MYGVKKTWNWIGSLYLDRYIYNRCLFISQCSPVFFAHARVTFDSDRSIYSEERE